MTPPGATEARRRHRQFVVAAGATAMLAIAFGLLLQPSVPEDVRVTASGLGLVMGGLLTAIGSSVAASRSAGLRRRAWLCFLAASIIALTGNIWGTLTGADPVSSPSVFGEASIALALVLSIAGLLSFPALRRRGVELLLLILDGLIVGGAALVIASVLVYGEVLATLPGDRVYTVVFPVLDIILATVALLLVARSRGDRVPLVLIGTGFILYATSDSVFALLAARGDFAFGTVVDLGWIIGYLMVALAAWYPSRGVVAQPDSTTASDAQGTVLVFAVLLVAALVQAWFGGDEFNATQAALWLVLVIVTGVRQTLLGIDNAALRRGLEQRVREQTADLRRLARQTEVLLASVGDGIYGVDPQGRITFVNPIGAAILGYETEQLVGGDAHQTFHAARGHVNLHPPQDCYVTESIRDGTVARAEQDTYIRRDGSPIPVEITSSPLIDGTETRGAVVAFRDITHRHEIDRMKNELLSVVSHELRTPLTSIHGTLGLLAGGALGELSGPAQRMAKMALASSDRLTRLINDILDVERIESGTMPMDFAEHAASDLVTASVKEVDGIAGAAGVEVRIAQSEGRVLADADRIVQTLTNLLGNAIKFSPRGAVVSAASRAEGGVVRFWVTDEGRGIPAEKLETVFERFEQVDSSDTRQMGGSGLGLAISRGIVTRHGGRIWAESQVGVGTTVTFEIPAAVVDGSSEPTEPGLNAPLVLVCDDDANVVATLSELLRHRGYRPIGVTDGRQAVERAIADRPAAVLMDLLMPDTSGPEAVARLRADERTSHIPIVIVSGLGPSADPGVATATDAWLIKPVGEEELANTVAAAVAGRRQATSVLIVEDDAQLASVLSTLLQGHGLDVSHVATVSAAVERAKEVCPQVIVLDLQLPDGSGATVIDELRRDGRLGDTSVVVYSAVEVAAEQRDALQLGPTVFLTKGRTSPAELESKVLQLVDAVTGRLAR